MKFIKSLAKTIAYIIAELIPAIITSKGIKKIKQTYNHKLFRWYVKVFDITTIILKEVLPFIFKDGIHKIKSFWK